MPSFSDNDRSEALNKLGRCMDCRIKSGNDEERNERNKEKKGSGTPAGACVVMRPHQADTARASSGTHSPSGVPPRHLRQRPNATAQLQLTHFLGRNEIGAGVTRSLPSQCSGFPRRPVVVPAGRITPEPPGSSGDEPPPAGTALAPPAGVTGWRPLRGRDDSLERN